MSVLVDKYKVEKFDDKDPKKTHFSNRMRFRKKSITLKLHKIRHTNNLFYLMISGHGHYHIKNFVKSPLVEKKQGESFDNKERGYNR